MRSISIQTYLTRYVLSLSKNNTLSVKKLSHELKTNPRLEEPFFLYVFYCEKEKPLKRFNKEVYTAYQDEMDYYKKCGKFKRERLTRTMNSYQNEVIRRSKQNYLKEIVIKECIKLKTQLKISDYQICKDLRINAGNSHGFFYQGQLNKLSYQKVEAVYDYLMPNKKEQQIKKPIINRF